MLNNQTIAFIGAGNMARALIGGLFRSGDLDPSRIRAARRSKDALAELEKQFNGIVTTSDNADAVSGADIIVLAVKPQNIQEILEEIRPAVENGALIISILAGISTNTIQRILDKDVPVVRAMPNTPALVDEGATALAAGKLANQGHLDLARRIFGLVGTIEVVPENLMHAVTGLSGSGPAYVYMVIEALTDGGVKQGLPRSTAFRLATQTVFGAAKLVKETGKHPAILRDEVTTPGGTAIAAVADLESHGLRTMLINAVRAATERSEELSKLNDR